LLTASQRGKKTQRENGLSIFYAVFEFIFIQSFFRFGEE
jgi:hypothetical protein